MFYGAQSKREYNVLDRIKLLPEAGMFNTKRFISCNLQGVCAQRKVVGGFKSATTASSRRNEVRKEEEEQFS